MKRFRVSFVPFVVDEAVSKSMNFKPNVPTAFRKICVPSHQRLRKLVKNRSFEIYTTASKLKKDQFSLQME
jgi:hypothetical protein